MSKLKIDDKILIELYNEGKTALEISNFFECGERTVYSHLAKLRLKGKIDYNEDFKSKI